jgi:mutator protein MutT
MLNGNWLSSCDTELFILLIISDTSPIIGLAICKKLDLLQSIFGTVYIPQAVYDELNVPGKPENSVISKWAKDKIVPAVNLPLINALQVNLDSGESEAISLYWEKQADYLLIDEKRGRSIARSGGIKIIGTAGVLLLSKERGFISEIKSSLDILIRNDFRVSDLLYHQLLQKAGEDTIQNVAAGIFIKDGNVLIARRNLTTRNPAFRGLWEFPGGKQEKGETIFQCLEREIMEEFGVQCRADKILLESPYTYDFGTINLVGITGELLDENLTLTVHDTFQWVKIRELPNYSFPPADLPLVERILSI